MAGDHIEAQGVVIKAQGRGIFLVKTDIGESIVVCKLSGKIRNFNIKIIEGDLVDISISPYDLTRGFITYRSKS